MKALVNLDGGCQSARCRREVVTSSQVVLRGQTSSITTEIICGNVKNLLCSRGSSLHFETFFEISDQNIIYYTYTLLRFHSQRTFSKKINGSQPHHDHHPLLLQSDFVLHTFITLSHPSLILMPQESSLPRKTRPLEPRPGQSSFSFLLYTQALEFCFYSELCWVDSRGQLDGERLMQRHVVAHVPKSQASRRVTGAPDKAPRGAPPVADSHRLAGCSGACLHG